MSGFRWIQPAPGGSEARRSTPVPRSDFIGSPANRSFHRLGAGSSTRDDGWTETRWSTSSRQARGSTPPQPAGRDQALDDPDRLRSGLRPAEHPVLPSERQNPQPALQIILVDRDLGVGQPRLQLASPIQGVVQRPRDRALRQVARVVVVPRAPVPDGIRRRKRTGSPELELLAAL
ncbi:MAG: hypothetical protein OXN84_08700 [Albidovulum sp.]|nr:hypothetical protein [Albidovulum sp.]